jgi:hypothetical protein
MSMDTLKGALKSKTVWWNVFMAFLASIELFASNLTTLFGQEVAAAVLLLGSMVNIFLRTVTTTALEEKK